MAALQGYVPLGPLPIRDLVSRNDERRVQMDVALGDAASRVTEQPGDRQLGKTKVAGDPSEGVSQNVRGHTCDLCLRAEAIQHPDDADEVAVANIGGKQIGRIFANGLAPDAMYRRPAEQPICSPLLVSGKWTA